MIQPAWSLPSPSAIARANDSDNGNGSLSCSARTLETAATRMYLAIEDPLRVTEPCH